MPVELPTSAHNEQLPDDSLTTLTLNYQWRRFVAIAVYSELMRQLVSDVESEQIQFEAWINALMDDLYNGEIVDGTPVGVIVWFPILASKLPPKWLICDGALLEQADYPELFHVLRDNFPFSGTTFELPNLTAQFLYGPGNDGQIADSGGSAVHTLTVAEIPPHTHTVERGNNLGNSTTRVAESDNNTGAAQFSNTSSVGSGDSHNNMPPYMRGFWIIKALP